MHNLICDNLGMTRDVSISSLSKGENGSSNYAFENHNIRILAMEDNTKFSVTNEKSTAYEGNIRGLFLGGCTCGRYLVLFVKDRLASPDKQDCIYRLEYNGSAVQTVLLYRGNLNFVEDMDTNGVAHPIEAIGYYESEEIQKVYWVDGVNQNRFINIIDTTTQYNDYSFDFQGRINNIPTVSIKKNYESAGTFQAGVLQYFMTYYNKYGVETCLIWNSDLQYISMIDRGAKADEAVACGFDIEISNLASEYNYLRIYAAYRSGINGVVSSRIVADIDLEGVTSETKLSFTDLGSTGTNFNSEDLPYVGGQDLRANTLDYKQDTLFLGDITIQSATSNIDFPKREINIASEGDFEEAQVKIKEGYNPNDPEEKPFLFWAYKYVSPIAKEGIYEYTPEISKSQKDVAGFKYRELYRFGIQFMDHEGTWTPAYWIGDKYCNLPPRTFTDADRFHTYRQNAIPDSAVAVSDSSNLEQVSQYPEVLRGAPTRSGGNIIGPVTTVEEELEKDTFGNYVKWENGKQIRFNYEADGCYIATIMLDIDAVKNSVGYGENGLPVVDFDNYVAYRLLVAETDITNRRVIEQGVINPTMFNYVDRYYNRPFSIPSWIFRPRLSEITHRHYDTLPVQSADNAELQGIIEKQLPGFKGVSADDNYFNSYIFMIAANEASVWSGFIQWKLIYYNSGSDSTEKAEKLYLSMYTGMVDDNGTKRRLNPNIAEEEAELQNVAALIAKYHLKMRPTQTDTTSDDGNYPGRGIVTPANQSEAYAYLTSSSYTYGYVPIGIYGDNYKVISSRIYDNGQDSGTPSKWTTLRGKLVDWITEDMQKTTPAEVGDALAGKIVLSQAMLPDEDLIKDIARTGSSGAEIALAILAGLAAVSSVVLSAISFGTLTIPLAMAAATCVSASSTICAAGAVGAASAAASLDLDSISNDLPKKMLALGYKPVGGGDSGLNSRQNSSRYIGLILEKFFNTNGKDVSASGSTPAGYTANSSLTTPSLTFTWNVPVLNGESVRDGHVDWSENDDDIPEADRKKGCVPFTTGNPYTSRGHIGEDYNAFFTSGTLTSVDEEESDLDKKQNLFCVDESIVTLNSPDIEDIAFLVNGSPAFRLDLIGIIPIDATQGMYHMATESGLNSNSQILQGRFNVNPIGDSPMKAKGMLNGYLYQDFTTESDDEFVKEMQVTEATAAYKVFMWNKRSAGFWFPGVTLKNPVDGSKLTRQTSKITNKIFANLRYSTNTLFFPTKKCSIETPVVCMDAEAMLKTFKHNSDTKNYYENVDTISINRANYSLIKAGANYPSSAEKISLGNMQDPIHIRYKETPHIVIPFSWDKNKNAARILPYLASESALSPLDMYDTETLGNAKLYGIFDNTIPISDMKYFFLAASNTTDGWNKADGEVTSSMSWIVSNTDTSGQAGKVCDRLKKSAVDTKFSMLPNNEAILLKSGTKYYVITCECVAKGRDFITNDDYKWYSKKITYLPANTRISRNGSLKYYSLEGATSNKLPGDVSIFYNRLSDFPIVGTWLQDRLNWDYKAETPYLFLGELIRKSFDYDDWNGGISDNALEQLVWNVASFATPMDQMLTQSWGDTYYQRWDCEKTYPFTEEDVNSNVEVLSFMLESHKNLDGRCDVNRGIHNLVNVRPSNTIYNEVYSQKDNFFTYQVLDEKFSKSHFEADVIWSLTKNNMDDIDKWTCLLASNEMSLDGRYGTVRKILNVNDVLIAFQDTAIANIKYNETAALNTTSGLPLQIGNTGKVDGYRMLSDTIGCHNKFSINKNSAGVFFADDFGKSFNQFSTNGGIVDISMRANFSAWFKKALNGHLWDAVSRSNFRTSYDEITHDLYIVKNDTCLIYNTLLQKFTSFMDYIDTPIITRLISKGGDSDTFAIRSTINASRQNIIEMWKMFAGASTSAIYGTQGAYGYLYGQFRPYSMEYRLNPDPLHDSIFTNYQYAADWTDPTKEVDEDNIFDSSSRRYTTFDTVEAKNEYQQGIMAIQQSGNIAGSTVGLRRVFGRQPVKSMFRLWRGDIPRDNDTLTGHTPLSDRMRNPWIHLKFEKSAADDSKMTFHNLMVNYYNQYGRF